MVDPANVVLPHMKITWGGVLGLGAGSEVWSNGLHFGSLNGQGPSEAELPAIAVIAADQLSQWIQRADSFVSQMAKLTWVKAIWVQANGKQRGTNTALADVGGDVRGGIAPANIWAQSYAITLRTALNRGRGHAGRVYPPASGPTLVPTNGGPYIAVTAADQMATSFRDLMTGITNVVSNSLGNGRAITPVIVSRATDRAPLPLLTPITRVVVDRVADIQHRRTNRIARAEGTTLPFPAV